MKKTFKIIFAATAAMATVASKDEDPIFLRIGEQSESPASSNTEIEALALPIGM